MLPVYLSDAVEHFGDPKLIVVQELERYIARMTNSELSRLAATYEELAQHEHHASELYLLATTHPKSATGHRAWSLVVLLEELGRQGIAPFSSGKVQFQQPEESVDWSATPAEIQQWAALADKYGTLDDVEMLEIADGADDKQFAAYSQLQQKWKREWPKIETWFETKRITESTAAWRIYRLSMFLDHFAGG